MGNPLWQPDGGQVSGAIEFDGTDDFISAPAPLSPADGPFSGLIDDVRVYSRVVKP